MKNDFPHDDEKKRVGAIEKLLTEQTYTELTAADFGKRQLAYQIQKQKEGCYVLVTFKADTINIGRFEQQVKLTEGVLRYLLTRVD